MIIELLFAITLYDSFNRSTECSEDCYLWVNIAQTKLSLGDEEMTRHLLRWYTFYVFFGLLPVIISAIFRFFSPNTIFNNNSIELLFLSFLVCATSLDDLSDIKSKCNNANIHLLDILYYIFFILTILISIIYGMRAIESATDIQLINAIDRFVASTVLISVVCVVLGTIVQVILFKIREGS